MQPCLPVAKARAFWRGSRALTADGRHPSRRQARALRLGLRRRAQAKRTQYGTETATKSPGVRNRIGIAMAETTEKTGEKTLSVAPTKTLSLKGRGVEQGVVRQSF